MDHASEKMTQQSASCKKCKTTNSTKSFFCRQCGAFLPSQIFDDKQIYEADEWKIRRILENLNKVPHFDIIWDDTVDLYTKKVEQLKELSALKDLDIQKLNSALTSEMMDFLSDCRTPEFQIAFVGTIKTGKSTLINALLGNNYASMDVTPETAALTKFHYSAKDCVKVVFYSKTEWEKLWQSRSSAADAFMQEYNELKADTIREKWVGHATIYKELENSQICEELTQWSSSKHAEHYFVKEIEVGISSLPANFPPEVVFVDTPGLSDPVGYRSDITRQYIRRANAVFVCVDAMKINKEEIETISSVFSFSSDNKNKVYVIATRWDALNYPDEDWEKQKKYLENRLVGPGFFADIQTAKANIMRSAAFIYNLCRDFKTLSDYDLMQLRIFGMKMNLKQLENIQENLEYLKEKTNIAVIMRKITTVLAKNYKVLLAGDLGKAYNHIIYEMRRIGNEKSQQEQALIDASSESLAFVKEKLTQQEQSQKNVQKHREILMATLEAVQKNTDERMNRIVNSIEQFVENLESESPSMHTRNKSSRR